MKRQSQRALGEIAQHRALLIALSQDLALPLLQVKSAIELMQADDFAQFSARQQARAVSLSADTGLQLVEAYRLLLYSDQVLGSSFEAKTIGAIFDSVAHQLTPYAKQYDTKIEVDIQGRLTPILAHQPSLIAAMGALGSSLIRAQVAQGQQSDFRLILGAHRSMDGQVIAGAFSNVHGLSNRSLRAARSLVGSARQPLPSVPPGTASGILVADMLCAQLWRPLRSAAHKSLGGLATSLPTSKQLNLV